MCDVIRIDGGGVRSYADVSMEYITMTDAVDNLKAGGGGVLNNDTGQII